MMIAIQNTGTASQAGHGGPEKPSAVAAKASSHTGASDAMALNHDRLPLARDAVCFRIIIIRNQARAIFFKNSAIVW